MNRGDHSEPILPDGERPGCFVAMLAEARDKAHPQVNDCVRGMLPGVDHVSKDLENAL